MWSYVYIYFICMCVCVCVYEGMCMCVYVHNKRMEGKKHLWAPEQPLNWRGLQQAWRLVLKTIHLVSTCLDTCKSDLYWFAASLPQNVLLVSRVSGKWENSECKTLGERLAPLGKRSQCFLLHGAFKGVQSFRKAIAAKQRRLV